MIPGFNSNISYAGVQYHVQTEDLGQKHPFVLTLVYREGAIIAREKVNYREALGENASEAEIKTFMEQQHRRIMASVMTGQLQDPAASPSSQQAAPHPASAPPCSDSPSPDERLDQAIAEYLRTRRAAESR